MNCPYCNYHFGAVVTTGDLQQLKTVLNPILCEGCLEIAIMDRGTIRKITDKELKQYHKSPAYIDVIEPLRTRLWRIKQSFKGRSN